ncbi:MAG: hypothetical protein HKN07_06180 [Acidimicrobiia bacterium]|nr:hypothetical protein [Acidimicrobiia bacterium]
MRFAAVLLLIAAACSATPTPDSDEPPDTTLPPTTTPPVSQTEVTPDASSPLGADGNHRATVTATASTWDVTSLELSDSPISRIASIDVDGEVIVAVRDTAGRTQLVPLDDPATATDLGVTSGPLRLGTGTDGPAVIAFPADLSQLSEPALLSDGSWVYIAANGAVVLWNGSQVARTESNALPDGRVLVDEQDRILVLVDPSERYAHGILGDDAEAIGWMILDTPSLTEIGSGQAIEPAVFELRYPMWVDLDGDGTREILLTESGPGVGARLVVHDESGREIAASPPIGTGNRWRHAFAAGPAGPDGTAEIIEVVTPHLSGLLTAWTFDPNNPELTQRAVTPGFTSHAIGSRVLDGAAAVDLDGNGSDDVALLRVSRTELVTLTREAEGFVVNQEFALPSAATSNLLVLSTTGGPLLLIGTRNGELALIQGSR